MSLRERPWLSAALWGAATLALVLVNSGSVLLAVVLAVVVAAISHRIERFRQQ